MFFQESRKVSEKIVWFFLISVLFRNSSGNYGERVIKSKRPEVVMAIGQEQFHPYARAEWDTPTHILVHKPGGEIDLPLLGISASLYQGPFSKFGARREHNTFVKTLRELLGGDVPIEDVVDMAVREARQQEDNRERLRELFRRSVTTDHPAIVLLNHEKDLKYALEFLSERQIVNYILQQPTINIQPDSGNGTKRKRNKGLSAMFETRPLSDLLFLRDQQIITDKGVVLGNMNSDQRPPEIDFMSYAWKCLGVKPSYAVTSPGKLEGGDFIPAGDIAFIGIGARTNFNAVQQLLENKCLGYDEVAVVVDPINRGHAPDQREMHLDTYFNIMSPKNYVVLDERVLDGHPKKAFVIVFKKNDDGTYRPASSQELTQISKRQRGITRDRVSYPAVPLKEYMGARGWNDPIEITLQQQRAYASNFLTIGENKIICVDIAAKERIKRKFRRLEQKLGEQSYFPLRDDTGKEIDYRRLGDDFLSKLGKRKEIQYNALVFNYLNLFFGGPHCLSQVVRGDGIT